MIAALYWIVSAVSSMIRGISDAIKQAKADSPDFKAKLHKEAQKLVDGLKKAFATQAEEEAEQAGY